MGARGDRGVCTEGTSTDAAERVPRPAAGEEYNPGAPTTPRQAASVILLRGGDRLLELLLVRRTPRARFMGGVWVFPGGAVDAAEGAGEQAHRAAAVRELHEEAAVAL
jgi:8-oxo-dGTP pyrophosphatase MutT (NUDIX family)